MSARETDIDFEVANLRIPPNSQEAEQGVLGALLLHNDAWDIVGDTLTEADFYRSEHRVVFAAIASLVTANHPADVITVHEALAGDAEKFGVDMRYLHDLAQYVPSASNIRRHAQIVRERSLKRKLICASDELATMAFNSTSSVDEMVETATAHLLQLAEGGKGDDWTSMEAMSAAIMDRLQAWKRHEAKPDYLPTGLSALDERLDGGMRAGELYVIGARPGMGKTAIGLSIAAHVAEVGRRGVGIFSMEMPRSQISTRFFSMRSSIQLHKLKRPERMTDLDWSVVAPAVEKLARVPVFINDTQGLNINQLRSRARALRRKAPSLGLIVVDHLGLMAGTDPRMPRAYQLEEASKGLKALSKELGVPVLLQVQLNRKVEERTDQTPMLSDIRDSGSVEQDADMVAFVHRPIKANEFLAEEWKPYAKVNVAKLRDGEPGSIDLMYVGATTMFKDWPDDLPIPTSKVLTKRGGDL